MGNNAYYMGQSGLAWKGASLVNEALKAFRTSRGSADYDLSKDRETIQYRARSLFQNNSFAGALINTLDINVVGSGLKARPALAWELMGITREEAETWERKTKMLFSIWADSKDCDAERKNDFFQLQSLAGKTEWITGDCFALMKYRPNESAFGLRVKLMEGDRCQNPNGNLDTQKLAQGIEVNTDGAPLAYHFTKAPAWNLDNFTDIVPTVRVPAFDPLGFTNVVHCFTADRTDQRRGISVLAPIISQLKQQERYQDSELLAAVVSAMFTVFLKSNNPESAEGFIDGNVPDDQKVSNARGPEAPMELAPGAIVQMPDGYEAQFANPTRPNANYKPFVDGIFCEVAARVGLSYEVVLKMFNSSYNSVRAALLESLKTFKRVKYNFAADFCQPIYEKWLMQAILTGVIDAPGFFDDPFNRALWCRCDWIGDSSFLLDPLKETQAMKMQVDEQFCSRDEAVTMVSGGEYRRVVNEVSEEQKLRESLGVREPGSVSRSENVSAVVEEG